MKIRSLLLYFLIFLGSIALAQSPQAFKYQAIARDASGFPLTDTEISLQIKIYTNDGNSIDRYIENHFVTTNSFGLVNLEIGNGEVVEGSLANVAWGNGNQFIDVSIDVEGGTNFVHMGTSQILSVPMASYAEVAGNVVDTSVTNEIQKLTLSHQGALSLTRDGGEVDLSIFDDSHAIDSVIHKIIADSLYFQAGLDSAYILINNEVIRANTIESELAYQITQNAISIFNDSIYFQNLIDTLSLGSNDDSLYFQTLIDNNSLKILNDSVFLKSLIDQNTYDIQQEITRAILSEALNAGNININTQDIANLQSEVVNDSSFLKGLIDQNNNAILAEITRAISAELSNSNNIAINTQQIARNTQDILDDSISFQTQLSQYNIDLQQEITRAIYAEQMNKDSIRITYAKILADSLHFQTEINNLGNGGGLDPTLENGKIFIGNAGNVATGVDMTGDAQITNTGVLLISPNAITTNKIADANVSNAKLANSNIYITDDQGHNGQIELGGSLHLHGNGATVVNYSPTSSSIDITSSDNQLLSVNGSNLSISSGNIVDLSAIVGQVGPQGPTGPQGNDGVGVQSTINNGDGTFTITYTDGSSFTSADLPGPQGAQGVQGPTGAQGIQGNDGVGVQSTINNGDGTFTITYTDGSSFTSADLTGPQGVQGPIGPQGVIGPQGAQGVGVQATVDNGDGTFTITYTDGSSYTSADLTGPQGAQGSQGPQGDTGAQGPVGPQGAQGPQGIAGNDGADGVSINWLGTVFSCTIKP
jgi:hypothetical protein